MLSSALTHTQNQGKGLNPGSTGAHHTPAGASAPVQNIQEKEKAALSCSPRRPLRSRHTSSSVGDGDFSVTDFCFDLFLRM